ncbi:MAG TPA: inositol monophosphatase family protein [Gemmatimonadaceae bacterium]|nr:inositol monophosphatase family protein [Gemmatimonadaceae bacterium]
MTVQANQHAHALLRHITHAADVAARFIGERARTLGGLEWHTKARADFVSDVDTGAERIIGDALLDAVPGARIMGEELSPDAAPAAGVWFIVDPLDGTTNFLHGYPEYAVSIAALVDGALVAGMVRNVASGECFAATLGGGAMRDGSPIAVSTIAEPSRALIGTGIPFKAPEQLDAYLPQLAAVSRATAGVRRAGSAALDLCDVACGRFEAFWELTLSPWDFAAGMLIIREAGGVVTTTTGGAVPFAPSSIAAGSPTMHRWLLETLRHP